MKAGVPEPLPGIGLRVRHREARRWHPGRVQNTLARLSDRRSVKRDRPHSSESSCLDPERSAATRETTPVRPLRLSSTFRWCRPMHRLHWVHTCVARHNDAGQLMRRREESHGEHGQNRRRREPRGKRPGRWSSRTRQGRRILVLAGCRAGVAVCRTGRLHRRASGAAVSRLATSRSVATRGPRPAVVLARASAHGGHASRGSREQVSEAADRENPQVLRPAKKRFCVRPRTKLGLGP